MSGLKHGLLKHMILDAQFGFKAEHSTVDVFFIMELLTIKAVRDRKMLYCSFVDFKRAFDSVYHNGLGYKLRH